MTSEGANWVGPSVLASKRLLISSGILLILGIAILVGILQVTASFDRFGESRLEARAAAPVLMTAAWGVVALSGVGAFLALIARSVRSDVNRRSTVVMVAAGCLVLAAITIGLGCANQAQGLGAIGG